MQTCLDRRGPPPKQKTPPSTPPSTWNKNVVPSPVHAMELKGGAIGNTLREPIGNLKGTCWEQRKNGKKNLSPPTQN